MPTGAGSSSNAPWRSSDITQPDVRCSGHRAGVAQKAIGTQALAKQSAGHVEAHRQPAVLVRRFVKAIALAKRGSIVYGFLFKTPRFPGILVSTLRPGRRVHRRPPADGFS